MDASATPRRTQSALAELVQLANDKGYLVRDTSGSRGLQRSYTFGQKNVFSLHVRFDKFWRVSNAIYHKTGPGDLYIARSEKNKRDKVYWVLNFLPDTFEFWDKCFPRGDV